MASETTARVGHTPGPWRYHELSKKAGWWVERAEGYRSIASVISCPEAEANARLIAAAPDLLAACKEFVRKCECGEARSVRSYAQMKAAIAKAEARTVSGDLAQE